MEDFYSEITDKFDVKEVDIKTYSPLSLAFVGDCVFDLVIRSILAGKGNIPNGKLHTRKSAIVKASAQAEMADALLDILTEEEEAVYKRGRNAHTGSKAKNATDSDYHKATGLEALMGYLYMTHRQDRVLDLIKTGLEKMGIMGSES